MELRDVNLISGNAEYFKKSFVLPNPDGQQTKKSWACLLRSKMRPAQ